MVHTILLMSFRDREIKGFKGKTISNFEATDINPGLGGGRGENISRVSERQGENLQFTVHNSSTLVSYWFVPSPSLALDTQKPSVALNHSPLGCGMRGFRHWTSNSNVLRIIQGNTSRDPCPFFKLRQQSSLFAAASLSCSGMQTRALSRWSAKRKRREAENK